jgi:formamidopyrimidine-DNA glycosylase
VYGREGQPCRRCGGTVRRTVVGQRGTHWCRGCQHR